MDRDIEERTVYLYPMDEDACKRLKGLFDRSEGVCKVRVRERKSLPGFIEIVKMKREEVEYRR